MTPQTVVLFLTDFLFFFHSALSDILLLLQFFIFLLRLPVFVPFLHHFLHFSPYLLPLSFPSSPRVLESRSDAYRARELSRKESSQVMIRGGGG